MTTTLPTGPAHAARNDQRGHALTIQVVIVLVIAGMVALPIVLIARSKAQARSRLLDDVVQLVTTSNRHRTELAAAYDRVAKANKRLPHAERVKYDYNRQFEALFHRYYDAKKGVDAGDSRPTTEDLLALKRDFEDYGRRVGSHYQRIKSLLDLVDLAEVAVQLARHYQRALHVVRDAASYEKNAYVLPQLEEADRQLGTAMNFVLSGIQQYPEDLKGHNTPTLIKTGIEMIRKVTADVDGLFERLDGVKTSRVVTPAAGDRTLEAFLTAFAAESAKVHLPALPEFAGGATPKTP